MILYASDEPDGDFVGGHAYLELIKLNGSQLDG